MTPLLRFLEKQNCKDMQTNDWIFFDFALNRISFLSTQSHTYGQLQFNNISLVLSFLFSIGATWKLKGKCALVCHTLHSSIVWELGAWKIEKNRKSSIYGRFQAPNRKTPAAVYLKTVIFHRRHTDTQTSNSHQQQTASVHEWMRKFIIVCAPKTNEKRRKKKKKKKTQKK